MNDETAVVAEWITSALSSVHRTSDPDDGVCGVYEGIAPVDAVEPYIVFSFVVAPDISSASGQTVYVRPDVDVKAVCQGGSYAPLTPISKAIQTALHGARQVTTSGGTVLTCRRTAAIRYTEVSGGKVYRHLGGTYRIASRGE